MISAASAGATDILKLLLEREADPKQMFNKTTALHGCAQE
jgi:ankyrin repeat protein